MKLKVLLLAALVSGIGFGEVYADSFTDVLSDLDSYLTEISKCESVQVGMQEPQNKCSTEQSTLISKTRNEIARIEAKIQQEKYAEIKKRVDELEQTTTPAQNTHILRNFLRKISKCESVQVGNNEYETHCTFAFIDFVSK